MEIWGSSFARDLGLEGDWDHGGWKLSAGMFLGAGAHNSSRDNGPLGVARVSYGREVVKSSRVVVAWRVGGIGPQRCRPGLFGSVARLEPEPDEPFRGAGYAVERLCTG